MNPSRTHALALVCGLLAAGTVRAASSPAAEQAISEAIGAALQADARRAVAALERVPDNQFDGNDAEIRTCMLHRLTSRKDEESTTASGFTNTLIAAYRRYWRAALALPAQKHGAEATLLTDLQTLLAQPGIRDLERAERLVTTRLAAEGLYALQGSTGLLRELMIWEKQEAKDHTVSLPDGEHTIRVILLDAFRSLGWADWATCGRRGTGGWAKPVALYAVAPRYPDRNGEAFRVSFLAHETQHSVDQRRWRDIPSWRLEYRAKLAELALATVTRAEILRRLREDQGDDVRSPHAYANKRALAALSGRLGESDLAAVAHDRLQRAAALELAEDTRRQERSAPEHAPAVIQ